MSVRVYDLAHSRDLDAAHQTNGHGGNDLVARQFFLDDVA